MNDLDKVIYVYIYILIKTFLIQSLYRRVEINNIINKCNTFKTSSIVRVRLIIKARMRKAEMVNGLKKNLII